MPCPRRTALAIVLLLAARDASAGNTDSFYYSDDAAMTAGAVVATTRDAGAVYYNPAGLGGNTRGEVSFNGTALGFRIRTVRNALSTTVPGTTDQHASNLSSADFFSTPHALTLIRNVSPTVSVGFGLYVTALDVRNADSERSFDGASPVGKTVTGNYDQRVDFSLQETHYDAGPAVGWAIAPGVRIGAALFGTYGKRAGFSQYLLAFQSNDTPSTTVGSLFLENRELFTYLGIRAAAGIQLDPGGDWHLGVLVRSPEFLLSSSDGGAGIQTEGAIAPGVPGETTVALANPTSPFSAFDIVSPMRVIASIAHDFGKRTWVSAEVDLQTGVSNPAIDDQLTINTRVGGRWALSDKLGMGAGLFSDRSLLSSVPSTLGGDRVDYYGATVGLELLTPLSLKDKPGPDGLVLSTTLGVRYALGLGSARALDVDLTKDLPPRLVSVAYHEILPYIGSGVLF